MSLPWSARLVKAASLEKSAGKPPAWITHSGEHRYAPLMGGFKADTQTTTTAAYQ